jgi:hypothetical protein
MNARRTAGVVNQGRPRWAAEIAVADIRAISAEGRLRC